MSSFQCGWCRNHISAYPCGYCGYEPADDKRLRELKRPGLVLAAGKSLAVGE